MNRGGVFLKVRPFLWLLLANFVCGLFLFRGGLWGNDLLAPLDILPAACPKYHFMDPESSGIPANHMIVDQVTYDLPVQTSIYRAYRSGEIPWWDPYNWAGRPLLAEAHINGTEPIRVLSYLTLPFVWAYNWTRILNFLFSGMVMLLLLRHWRFPEMASVLLALAFEFSGGFMLFFGHPWIQTSLNYYPLMWLAWDVWFRRRAWWSLPVGTFAVAGAFNTGNLQSHAYVVLFAGAILLGYGGLSWKHWKLMLPMVAACGILGGILTLPLLTGELEFYTQNLRSAELQGEGASFVGGLFTLLTFYPWAAGDFRTLDLAKLFRAGNVGFYLYIGSAAVLFALLGAFRRITRVELSPVKRTGMWLVAIYLLIVCSPLKAMFYSRSAGLGLLGITILAAFGVDFMMNHSRPMRVWGRFTIILVVLTAVLTNVASLLVYPRYVPKVREMVQAWSQRTVSGFRHAVNLRDFQINNFSNEVSFKNPETVLACVAMLAFAGICLRPGIRQRKTAVPAVLVLNLLPVLLFAHRFIPVHSVELWHQLLEGPEQRRVAGILNPNKLRLAEFPRAAFDCVYPNALAHLFEVRTTHGYSSLWPRSFFSMTPEGIQRWMPQVADYLYISPIEGDPSGYLKKNLTPGLARFQWVGPEYRRVTVEKETMNTIELRIEEGTEAKLVRTDTYYPGWTAWIGDRQLEVQHMNPSFSTVMVPAGPQTLILRYQPTYLRLSLKLAGAGLALLVVGTLLLLRFCRPCPPAAAPTEPPPAATP